MRFKEVRQITAYALQQLCIRKNWYTGGTCREYEKFLAKADSCEILTTEIIAEIAEDIINHSSGISMEDMTSVMFDVAKESVTFFYECAEQGDRYEEIRI